MNRATGIPVCPRVPRSLRTICVGENCARPTIDGQGTSEGAFLWGVLEFCGLEYRIPAVWFDDSSFLGNEFCGFFGEFCGILGGSCGPSAVRMYDSAPRTWNRTTIPQNSVLVPTELFN